MHIFRHIVCLHVEGRQRFEDSREVLEMLACDLESSAFDGCSVANVDQCAEFVVDQCYLQLAVQCDIVLVRSLLCHVCPHILEPSRATAILFCVSGVMGNVVGKLGAERLRCLIVRHILQIPGEPREIEVVDALQDSFNELWFCTAWGCALHGVGLHYIVLHIVVCN